MPMARRDSIYEGKNHKKVPYFWNFNLFIKIPLRTQSSTLCLSFFTCIPAIENQELQNNGKTQLQFLHYFKGLALDSEQLDPYILSGNAQSNNCSQLLSSLYIQTFSKNKWEKFGGD